MAIFNNMSITTKGQVLYAKAQAGTELKFTKMMVGSGQIENRNPATLVSLIEPKFSIGIQSITPNTELKTATISATINNSEVTEATYICEIGLYAQDPDDGEILYAYGSAGTYGDYYAPASQGAYSWNYQINAAIGNAANVTIELSNLVYDYAVINSNTTFILLSGGNQKEINKNIDKKLSEMMYEKAGGTETALTLTIQTPLKDGCWKKFIASGDNNGKATTINGKPFYKICSTNPPNLKENRPYEVYYNLTGDCFFLKASATGTTSADKVLAGETFSTEDDTDLIGTMPNRGVYTNKNFTLNGQINLPKGYYESINISQSIATKGAITDAISTVVDQGYLYYRIPQAAYFTNAASGYPEIRCSINALKNGLNNDQKKDLIEGMGGTRLYYGSYLKSSNDSGDLNVDLSNCPFSPKVITFKVVDVDTACGFYDFNIGKKMLPGEYKRTSGVTTAWTVRNIGSFDISNVSIVTHTNFDGRSNSPLKANTNYTANIWCYG